jgi:hypothetical protein
VSLEDLIAGFAASLDYCQTPQDNIDDWLSSAYQDILGRQPDAAGFRQWRQVLMDGKA